VIVGVAFGEDDLALQHNGAVPMAGATRQRGDMFARSRFIHVQPALARIDEQQAAGLERTGAAGSVFPFFLKLVIFQLPSGGAAVVGGEHPGLAVVFPYRRLGEQIRAAGSGNGLQFVVLVGTVAGDGLAAEQADLAILAALRDQVAAQQHGRARAQVEITRIQFFGIGRGVVAQHFRGTGINLDERVAPVGRAVPLAIAGGDEDVAVAGIDHSARTPPDGRFCLRTGVRLKQLGAVAAQRVPYLEELAGVAVENGDMALIGRPVADVARRHGNHTALEELQGRSHLLSLWQLGDGGAPDRLAIADGQLLDIAVGRGCIDGLPIGIGHGGGVGDLARARQRLIAGRRVFPQNAAASGIERQRFAVGRGDEDGIVEGAVDGDALQVNGASINGTSQLYLPARELGDVGSGDAGGARVGAGAFHIAAKHGPVLRRQALGGGRAGHARAKKQANHNPVSHAESTPPARTAVGSTSNGLDLREVPPNSTPRQARPLAGQPPSIAADPPRSLGDQG
jgi:hypothetical protein